MCNEKVDSNMINHNINIRPYIDLLDNNSEANK